MNKEYSYGGVVYRKEKDGLWFLVIYKPKNDAWGFPKGHPDEGESELDAALREISEETGLTDLNFIEGFRREEVYEAVSNRPPYKGEKIEKHSAYFLCRTGTRTVNVDGREITDFRWLPADEADKLVTFENSKNTLREAVKFLKEKNENLS